ncbi:MAG: hypothetical protein RLZZ245_692, partial [Verrucomicrobiota bacterium]
GGQNIRLPTARSVHTLRRQNPHSPTLPWRPWRLGGPNLFHLLHRSANILSATVRATFCRPNSKEQTADRISACRQRAECTRSVDPNLFHLQSPNHQRLSKRDSNVISHLQGKDWHGIGETRNDLSHRNPQVRGDFMESLNDERLIQGV